MFEKNESGLPLWHFNNLSAFADIRHFVSGRAGGVSTGEKGSLNLSFNAEDISEHVNINRTRLANALGLPLSRLLFPGQTHSNHVAVVRDASEPLSLNNTDALITDCKGISVCVMSADCVPVLLYDVRKKAIGAVHAGWKGTTSKILTATVIKMQEAFQTDPADLIAAIGPSIGPEVYEVGEEVIIAAQKAFGRDAGVLHNTISGKGHLDLWKANLLQLTALGVPEASVEVAGICTYTQHELFFSARRSQHKAGRFAAGILLV
jgi:YfiH family protein